MKAPPARRHRGEPDKDEGPVDRRPGERACHGWQALGFRAMQDSIAQKVPSRGPRARAEKAERRSRTVAPASLTATLSPALLCSAFRGRAWY